MALITRRVAEIKGGAAYIEVTVDDTDIAPGFDRGEPGDTPDPLAGARITEVSVTRPADVDLWIAVYQNGEVVIDTRTLARPIGRRAVNVPRGRRYRLGDFAIAMGTG